MFASEPFPRPNQPSSITALGLRIDITNYSDAVRRILGWAGNCESRAVAVANVHMVMEAYDDRRFQNLLNDCDLVTADGMPLVWLLRAMGTQDASRVYGPDLTRELLMKADEQRIPIGFYGGTARALDSLLAFVRREYPNVPVVYACAPPFRPLESKEEERVIEDIRSSGARILLVGLGCPKQERWVAAHKGRIPAVLIAVGAAFDFLSGAKMQAPHWMQRCGLEWLFRLATEPRRLFWRYARNNPRFLFLVSRQLWTERAQRQKVFGGA